MDTAAVLFILIVQYQKYLLHCPQQFVAGAQPATVNIGKPAKFIYMCAQQFHSLKV